MEESKRTFFHLHGAQVEGPLLAAVHNRYQLGRLKIHGYLCAQGALLFQSQGHVQEHFAVAVPASSLEKFKAPLNIHPKLLQDSPRYARRVIAAIWPQFIKAGAKLLPSGVCGIHQSLPGVHFTFSGR